MKIFAKSPPMSESDFKNYKPFTIGQEFVADDGSRFTIKDVTFSPSLLEKAWILSFTIEYHNLDDKYEGIQKDVRADTLKSWFKRD